MLRLTLLILALLLCPPPAHAAPFEAGIVCVDARDDTVWRADRIVVVSGFVPTSPLDAIVVVTGFKTVTELACMLSPPASRTAPALRVPMLCSADGDGAMACRR